jgi:CheY-like chemotaxis protein
MPRAGGLRLTTSNSPIPPSEPRRETSARRILVVDDEPVIRRIADFALSAAGHAVFEAGNAARAIEAVKSASQPFDLVLLDLTLPDGDGTAVIPAIRGHSPGTRVLVVSGLGAMNPSDVGADGYLAKPFTKSALLDAVQQTLGSGSASDKPQRK